jgi:hypothetical protein
MPVLRSPVVPRTNSDIKLDIIPYKPPRICTYHPSTTLSASPAFAMASDDAAKARIISHLNSSHADSLSAYLQHYNLVPLAAASKPTLLDISLSAMTIRDANNKVHTVRFSPPMNSFSDARVRTVAMDTEARRALGVRITSYLPPRKPFHIIVFGLVAMTYTLDLTYQWIVPGTFMYDVVLPWYPGGREWFFWMLRMQMIPTLVIHATEAFLMDRMKLSRYGVQRWSGLWWKWMLSCFVEGVGSFQRIGAEVKRQEAVWEEKEKEKAANGGQH